METLDYCMNGYVELIMDVFRLNPLGYVSLPGFSFDYWVTILVTLQDKQLLDNFNEAQRGGICGMKGDRFISHILGIEKSCT